MAMTDKTTEEIVERLGVQLDTIGREVQSWIDWSTKDWAKQGATPNEETAIMQLPAWPRHGQLANWVMTLAHAALTIKRLSDERDKLQKRLGICRDDSKSLYEQGLNNCRVAEQAQADNATLRDALKITTDTLERHNKQHELDGLHKVFHHSIIVGREALSTNHPGQPLLDRLKGAERLLTDIEAVTPNWKAYRSLAEAVEVAIHHRAALGKGEQ